MHYILYTIVHLHSIDTPHNTINRLYTYILHIHCIHYTYYIIFHTYYTYTYPT